MPEQVQRPGRGSSPRLSERYRASSGIATSPSVPIMRPRKRSRLRQRGPRHLRGEGPGEGPGCAGAGPAGSPGSPERGAAGGREPGPYPAVERLSYGSCGRGRQRPRPQLQLFGEENRCFVGGGVTSEGAASSYPAVASRRCPYCSPGRSWSGCSFFRGNPAWQRVGTTRLIPSGFG